MPCSIGLLHAGALHARRAGKRFTVQQVLCGQIDAGAEVILTQPPLLWPVFEQWMEGVARYMLWHAASSLRASMCVP